MPQPQVRQGRLRLCPTPGPVHDLQANEYCYMTKLMSVIVLFRSISSTDAYLNVPLTSGANISYGSSAFEI